MTDEEFYDYNKCGFSFFTSAIFLPMVVFVFQIFGYTNRNVTIFEVVALVLLLISFIRKDWYLRKHTRFISRKEYLFQTISFIALILFSVILGFLVSTNTVDDRETLTYYPGNLIVFLSTFLYSLIVLGYMAKTGKSIMKLVKPKYDELNKDE